MGLVLFGVLVFPNVFFCFLKTFGKTNKTKENHRKPKTTSGKPKKQSFWRFQTHPWIWVWSCLVFWFSLRFLENQKKTGKPKKTNKTKPISKGGSETFENFACLVFPKVCLVFFGFLWYVWCSRSFFKVVSMLRF